MGGLYVLLDWTYYTNPSLAPNLIIIKGFFILTTLDKSCKLSYDREVNQTIPTDIP
jgi:hypothetical protein